MAEGRKPQGVPFHVASTGLPAFPNTEGATGSFPFVTAESARTPGQRWLHGTGRVLWRA